MKYKSKPVEIEAVQLGRGEVNPQWLTDALTAGKARVNPKTNATGRQLVIETLEGTMTANEGDWIICGTEGELYPCKDSVFQRKYEPAED